MTRSAGIALLVGLALPAVPARADSISLCTVMADAATGGILHPDGAAGI